MIRLLHKDDIQPIAAAFAELGWNKPASQYESYLMEQEAGQRVVLVARVNGVYAGYVTIVWKSHYRPFQEAGIPEIVDFNVLPKFRRRGIGSQLLDEAERRIAERSMVAGIGVGLTADYGAAQVLYTRRGYIPDGRGLMQAGQPVQYSEVVTIGDAQTLYFCKQLRSK